ncbi:hypothetical protein F4803DRAFT_555321 [Xylaria telfairii]|nr:hypothetical protein F4803DRAFT_555321 [Xylaria telfairii]
MPAQLGVGVFTILSNCFYCIVRSTRTIVVYLVRLGLRIISRANGRQNYTARKTPRYDWIKGWEPEQYVPIGSSDSGLSGGPDCPRVESRLWRKLCSTLPDPEVLDFLLLCVHAAVQGEDHHPAYIEWFALPRTFPLQPSAVHEVIDSFPALNHTSTISNLMGTENLQNERYIILQWLDQYFRDQIIPADDVLHIPDIPSLKQFIQLDSESSHQAEFMKLMELRHLEMGQAGFHGTPAINLLNILYKGLVARVDTVSYASHPELAIQFIYHKGAYYNNVSPGIMKGWKNSAFKNVIVLLGVEIAKKDIEWIPFDRYYKGRSFQSEVAVRQLFVIPGSVLNNSVERHRKGEREAVIPYGSRAKTKMEHVYRCIRRGDW